MMMDDLRMILFVPLMTLMTRISLAGDTHADVYFFAHGLNGE